NNVKVIASDAGVTACHNGGTHMSFEDMGIVRGLAHSVVLEVTPRAYEPFIDLLRANMQNCGALRIDHVMSLLRLWWIPYGETAD
ncbi:4-alpha-glucanotransferase, partial [Salmonella enterica subsp. enterica serovar Virginia]|nr:4-alpha-glucanotransferase [Salmonella enterica subsp. enterica serovar Virginia]